MYVCIYVVSQFWRVKTFKACVILGESRVRKELLCHQWYAYQGVVIKCSGEGRD